MSTFDLIMDQEPAKFYVSMAAILFGLLIGSDIAFGGHKQERRFMAFVLAGGVVFMSAVPMLALFDVMAHR